MKKTKTHKILFGTLICVLNVSFADISPADGTLLLKDSSESASYSGTPVANSDDCCGGQGSWISVGSVTYEWGDGSTGASYSIPTSSTGTQSVSITATQEYECSEGNETDTGTDDASAYYTVYEVTQFMAKINKDEICHNETLTEDDFNIVTQPGTAADSLGWEWDGSVNTGSSSETKKARLVYDGNTVEEAIYTVYPGGEYIAVSNLPKPAVEGANISKTGTSYDNDGGWWTTTYYKTTVTWSGGFVWDQIGRDTVGAGQQYQTSQSKKWAISGSVTGEAEVSIPMVAGAKVSVTVGGSWETSTSHSLTSGGDAGPTSWRYGHYQEVWGASRSVQTWKRTDPSDPWASYTESGFTGTYPESLCGAPRYLQTKEKVCPQS